MQQVVQWYVHSSDEKQIKSPSVNKNLEIKIQTYENVLLAGLLYIIIYGSNKLK